jgi:serine/threonine protein kinase
MTERCPQCHAYVADAGVAPGGALRCDRCGARFAKAKPVVATAGRDEAALGIHPALARKYAPQAGAVDALPAAPKPLAGDTRVLGGRAVVSAEGAAVEPNTSPGRPAARRSYDGLAGTPPPAVKAPRPEEPLPLIPGYAVEAMIGKGAMGRVYRARQLSTGRLAAIKTLAPELAVRPDFVARFEREGAAMRAIRHPGVVQVWDQGKASGDVYYIAMEFIEGHPLRKFLEPGPLEPRLALRFSRLILQALAAAHAPGVIHRDLKPENILMRGAPGEERPVLVDFGLAGIMEEENDPHPNLTKSRMTMGTVNYMAPEQRTDAKRVDQRADVYAAGVIFYELLTGDLPLGRFNLPRERGLRVPASVDQVVVTALARNAEERFQTARDFDKALGDIEAELGIAATTPLERDTVVAAADVLAPPRPTHEASTAPPPVGGRAGLRRDSSEPGLHASPGALAAMSMSPAHAGPPMGSLAGSLPGSFAGSFAGSLAGTFVEGMPAAWATVLPTVQPRWIAAATAALLGSVIGLLLLRGL